MVHDGQGLAFRLQAGQDLLGVHAQLDDLQGHPAVHGLGLLRQPYLAHPSLPQEFQELVWPNVVGMVWRI
jgi:hypothetical protein